MTTQAETITVSMNPTIPLGQYEVTKPFASITKVLDDDYDEAEHIREVKRMLLLALIEEVEVHAAITSRIESSKDTYAATIAASQSQLQELGYGEEEDGQEGRQKDRQESEQEGRQKSRKASKASKASKPPRRRTARKVHPGT